MCHLHHKDEFTDAEPAHKRHRENTCGRIEQFFITIDNGYSIEFTGLSHLYEIEIRVLLFWFRFSFCLCVKTVGVVELSVYTTTNEKRESFKAYINIYSSLARRVKRNSCNRLKN